MKNTSAAPGICRPIALVSALACLAGCAISPTTTPPRTTFDTRAPVAPKVDTVPPYAFDVAEEAGVPRRCIAHVMAADLLTRNSSPAVTIRINDATGAAYLSPTESLFGVFDVDNLDLPDGTPVETRTVVEKSTTYLTKVEQIHMSQGVAHDVMAVRIGQPEVERVNGKPPIGIIGFDILGNYDVLLDMPRQRVLFFRQSNAAGCPPLATWIAHAHQAPLLLDTAAQDTLVSVQLDGHAVGMSLEPGANVSIVSTDDARAAGLSDAFSASDDTVRTQAGAAARGSVILGTRHKFHDIQIGSGRDHDFSANIEPALYNVLGLNFFRHRKVMLAFADGMLFFDDTHPDLLPPDTTRAEFSPISSRLTLTHVVETPTVAPGVTPAVAPPTQR